MRCISFRQRHGQRRKIMSGCLTNVFSLLYLTVIFTTSTFGGFRCEAFSFRSPNSSMNFNPRTSTKEIASSHSCTDQQDFARVDKNRKTTTLKTTHLSLSSISSGGDASFPGRWNLRRERLVRSVIVAASCVITWMLTKSTKYNFTPVQASSIVGVSGCLLSPSWAVASFCGSFAGMSSQIVSTEAAWILGALCAIVFYICESGNKLLTGKGGRLGTIAFGGSSAYYLLFQNGLQKILQKTSSIFASQTAGLVTLSAILLQYLRTQDTGSSKAAAQAAWAKFLMLSVVMIELFGGVPSDRAFKAYLQTTAAIFGGSYVVKISDGFVLPAAVVGMLGSFLFPALAAPIYLGAFVGMTSLTKFDEWQLLQSSAFAAALYQLGLFVGFGGRLGFLAFLGVNFGM